jgi:hypothetical protein
LISVNGDKGIWAEFSADEAVIEADLRLVLREFWSYRRTGKASARSYLPRPSLRFFSDYGVLA